MTVDEIRELINLAAETGIAELEVQRGDNRVRIRRAGFAGAAGNRAGGARLRRRGRRAGRGGNSRARRFRAIQTTRERQEAAKAADPNLVLVKSPIVGTFYECPSPGAPPFVRVGERVQPGKVLCIIESMKLMNEIEAETSGIIESKLVMNGQPVEYGEALFAIRAV